MKIAFCGDSFCADITNDDYPSWPYLVANEFNGTITCKGLSGNALFHSYEELLPVVDESDYVVFCITDPHRLPNRHRIPITVANTEYLVDSVSRGESDWVGRKYSVTNKIVEKTLRAGGIYFTDLMSWEFHNMAHIGILMQIDNHMVEKKKKCIWFNCFDISTKIDNKWKYTPKSGPIINTPLSSISQSETKGLSQKKQDEILFGDIRVNHFNEKNNKNMANLVIDIIKNDTFNPREINIYGNN
jgi:hypothetical protein